MKEIYWTIFFAQVFFWKVGFKFFIGDISLEDQVSEETTPKVADANTDAAENQQDEQGNTFTWLQIKPIIKLIVKLFL